MNQSKNTAITSLQLQLASLHQSHIELEQKIDSYNRLIAENQRASQLELERLQQRRAKEISQVQESTAIASNETSGKWFAGGTQIPDTSAMLDPNNLAEMLRELDEVFKKR